MLMFLLLVVVGLLSSAQAVLIGDDCTNHTFCNYDGASPMDHSFCSGSTCQCTSLYHGNVGDSECQMAKLGDACTEDAYCQTACGRAVCSSGTCQCGSGKYEAEGSLGRYICLPTTVGSPCDPTNGGTAFCQLGVTNAECDSVKETCQCPTGEIFVPADELCQPASFVDPDCNVCRNTGGDCFDREDDNSPSGCACPSQKISTGTDDAGTLTHGCDIGLAEIGKYCDEDGYPVQCQAEHSRCVHAGELSSLYKCACDTGYFPVVSKYSSDVSICYRSLSEFTDPNCEWCLANGGLCYDIDDDSIRDGCMCPVSRSTPPEGEHDPRQDCAVSHLSLTCETSHMRICYIPHNTTSFPHTSTLLQTDEAYIYIKNFHGTDPCVFVRNPDTDDWCLTLQYVYNDTAACGTLVTYPEENLVSYQNWMVLQFGSSGRSNDDLFFHFHCDYNTLIHTITASGTGVVGFASVASEGEEVHPDLVMRVLDGFGRDASMAGVRLGQSAVLEVEMIDDKNVYVAIRPEVCIASSRPQLADPKTTSMLLLYDSCPYEGSALNVRNIFRVDLLDAMVTRTGLFSVFRFEGSEFVFFHCAVKVCRKASECAAVDCSNAGRRKRGLDGRHEHVATLSAIDQISARETRPVHMHGDLSSLNPYMASPYRNRRATLQKNPLENLQSAPIRILSVTSKSTGDESNTSSEKKHTGRAKAPLIIGAAGGFLCVTIIIGALLFYRFNAKRGNSRGKGQKPCHQHVLQHK